MNVTVVFDSSDVGGLESAYIVLSKHPDATIVDTAGLATAAITTLINALPATQDRIYALANVGTNPPSGNLTAGQITALDGKLSGNPGADTATIQIAANDDSATTLENAVSLRPRLTWESVYPVDTVAVAPFLTGRQDMFVVIAQSTATAGATGTLTDSAATYPVDGLVGLYVEITGGTGEGQIRKITTNSATVLTAERPFVTAPDATSTYRIRGYKRSQQIIVDTETATAGAAGSITNSGAAYTVDGLIGYVVRITGGTGEGQEVLITDNSATVITPAVDFATPPDATSEFDVIQYSYENFDETIIENAQTATSGSSSTIVNSAAIFPVNGYTGLQVRIVGGTGAGQVRSIASNTNTTITVSQNWAVTPDTTSEFEVVRIGGNWPYELADFYLDLALPLYNDVTADGNLLLWRAILGKRDEGVALNSPLGRAQDLTALNVILDKGKTVYDLNNPA